MEEIFGYSTEGRPISGVVLGNGRDTCLLFGVIHGNEPIGAPLLERLAAHLGSNPRLLAGKRVVVVPVTNPDGLARGSRSNVRGVDLNRNFPASNWAPRSRHGEYPGSEAETRTILRVVRQFGPSRILTVHSPLGCINYDGPAGPLAEELSALTGYPARDSIGYPTPGSFGSYAGVDRGIPTITLETGRERSPEAAWRRFGRGLLAFVASDSQATASGGTRPGRQHTGGTTSGTPAR